MRPEILAGNNILSQFTTSTFQQEVRKVTNTLVKLLRKYWKLGLQYKKIEEDLIELIIYSDGSFS